MGVMQDVHWSGGMIGYFSTYALGNLIGGQLWKQVHSEMSDLDDQLGAGELSGLREWLRVNVHQHGAGVQVGPFVEYLKAKLSEVYDLALA